MEIVFQGERSEKTKETGMQDSVEKPGENLQS